MAKVLSIIVPTYNMEKYLTHCLDSLILNQEIMGSYEVLIVNDGSKDSSSEIAHSYESRFPETFRVIDKENGNYGSCINRGLNEACGKYIKILDADDSYDTSAFGMYLKLISEIDADIITNNFVTVNESGKTTGNLTFDTIPQKTTILKECDIYPLSVISMHGLAYKRQMLMKAGYKQTEGVSYSDQEWSCIPFGFAQTIYHTGECLYRYLLGREGQTMDISQSIKSVTSLETVANKLIDHYESTDWPVYINIIFTKKLQMAIDGIYRVQLMYSRHLLPELLVQYDKNLLNNHNAVYHLLDDVYLHDRFVKVRYIKEWRQHHFMKLRVCFLYYKVLKRFQKMMTK